MKKFLHVLLVLCLLAGIVPAGLAQAADQVTTLTIFRNTPNIYDGMGWEWGTDEVTAYITEKLGIRVEYTWAISQNSEQFYTMLASGTDLPDLIWVEKPTGVEASALIEQGFVTPLNKLADEYYPEFYDVLPNGFREVYDWSDGNLYSLTRDYGDWTRKDEATGPLAVGAGISVNKDMLEALGNPELKTTEDLLNVALAAKEMFNTPYTIYLDHSTQKVRNIGNAVQMFTRMFGGSNLIWVQDDDTVKLNVRSDAYKDAARFVNQLYQSGLINPENFTITNDEQWFAIAENNQLFAHIGHPYNIERAKKGGQTADAVYWPIDWLAGPGLTQDEVKIQDGNWSNIGGTGGLFVSSTTKNPEAVMKLLTWMLSDEGQMSIWTGLEGSAWVRGDDGLPHYTEHYLEQSAVSAKNLAITIGAQNNNVTWVASIWAKANIIHERQKEQPPYYDWCYYTDKHVVNERLQVMAATLTDEDDILLSDTIDSIWQQAYPTLVLAEDDAAFDAAYTKLISDLDRAGLADLEAVYTENYQSLKARGIQ